MFIWIFHRAICHFPESIGGMQVRADIIWIKQSPRAWFGRFISTMRKYGFNKSNADITPYS